MDEGKLSLESKDIAAEKRQELLRLFPEVQTEGGKIDFDQLKRALGETIDSGRERYGMNWPGKADCFRLIQSPSTATLLPVREESVRFDETENMIIEGDNLEVLKLLQKGYQNKVKMIYIDPPYNTGNDFIYPDDFADSLKNYLQFTGQADSEGKRFTNNLESDGRFHSKWLNMMYPRLYLARNLLKEDGVIFISIGDDEFGALAGLLKSIFGEENFLGTFVWKRRASSSMAERLISTDHEYVVAYQRGAFVSRGLTKDYEAYANPDNDPRGPWRADNLTVGMNSEQRPNQSYPITDPKTGLVYPPNPNRVWSHIKPSMDRLIDEGRIIFPPDITRRPMVKRFQNELRVDVNPTSTWLDAVALNSEGTRELQELLGENLAIYPKPTSLLASLIASSVSAGDYVLDFFAGSGTTGQALLESEAAGANFILVQLPEQTGRNDYKTIAEITKERVRRVIQRQEKDAEGKLDLQQKGKSDRKAGFRVFKLAASNFKVWDAHTDEGVAGVERQMELAVNHIMPDRTAEDLFYEILMKSEYPLTAKAQSFDAAGIAAFSVEDDALIICVEREVTAEAVAAIAKRSPSKVIFLDEAFSGNDQLKANAKMNFESAGVKRFETV